MNQERLKELEQLAWTCTLEMAKALYPHRYSPEEQQAMLQKEIKTLSNAIDEILNNSIPEEATILHLRALNKLFEAIQGEVDYEAAFHSAKNSDNPDLNTLISAKKAFKEHAAFLNVAKIGLRISAYVTFVEVYMNSEIADFRKLNFQGTDTGPKLKK